MPVIFAAAFAWLLIRTGAHIARRQYVKARIARRVDRIAR